MIKDLPRITVVTPCYKSASTLEATIQSVLLQGYPNLEYIIVDGAGDDSWKIIEKYEDKLSYWISEPDGGQYEAITKGFARGTGEVFFLINADDLLLPRALFVVGEIFATFLEVEWLSTLLPVSWDASGYCSGLSRVPGFSRQAFLDGWFLPGIRRWGGRWIQQESTFFRKKLWDEIGGYFPAYSLSGDFALWCQMYRVAELYGCSYPLGGFRTIKGQRSEQIARYSAEAKSALLQFRQDVDWRGGGELSD